MCAATGFIDIVQKQGMAKEGMVIYIIIDISFATK
jgi:hypothetical protein